MTKLKKRWYLIPLVILFIGIISFVSWGLIIPSPMPEAMSALQSDSQVSVTTHPWLVFQPEQKESTTGLIFYPGGRVDPRAYTPAARAIAEQGYIVIIVPMPLNLAVLGSGRASSVIQHYPEIKNWVIGGHSLGGSMAALYADNHRDQIKGLLLWASYPAGSNDLSNSSIIVTSIYASQDGLATQDKIDASRRLLPVDTSWVLISGGNHAQFGWYGTQSGDRQATISREEQQAQVISASLALLHLVDQMP